MACQCCDCENAKLLLPDNSTYISPGDVVILHRFSAVKWVVGFGWFSYEGNRKICGWHLTQLRDKRIVKPIQEIDLADIYVVEV